MVDMCQYLNVLILGWVLSTMTDEKHQFAFFLGNSIVKGLKDKYEVPLMSTNDCTKNHMYVIPPIVKNHNRV